MKPSDFLTELSTEKLAKYKTAAAADASKADKEKDFARGDKRFSGIVKATKKQFANDTKQGVAEGQGSIVDKCASLAAKYFNSAGLQQQYDIDEFIKINTGNNVVVDKCASLAAKYFNSAGLQQQYDIGEYIKANVRQGVAEGAETEADIDKKIAFHQQGQAAAQYKGSMNKMHAAKIRDLEAKKAALKQGVAEGSEWETKHDEFTTVGDRATPEQIHKIVSALGVAAKQAGSKRGFLNQIIGKQSNGDLARMAHNAETLAKNIQRNSNAKPGTDERKELGQHLVYAVSLLKRMNGEQDVAEEKCPHCNGPMFSEMIMNEKKDACYYKVKSRYKVWPSAYASGALVKCRNKGASNWGNSSKNESSILEGIEQADESLHDWFNKEKWVRMDTKGNIKGPCAKEPGEGKPKCLPQAKAHSLGKKGRASAAQRKRREDPNPERSGKAINVNTKKK